MDYVLQSLRCDLSSHQEDYAISIEKLEISKRQKFQENIDYYKDESGKLLRNIDEIKKAIKILSKEK